MGTLLSGRNSGDSTAIGVESFFAKNFGTLSTQMSGWEEGGLAKKKKRKTLGVPN